MIFCNRGTLTVFIPPETPSLTGTFTTMGGGDTAMFTPSDGAQFDKIVSSSGANRIGGHFTPNDASKEEGAIPVVFSKGKFEFWIYSLTNPGNMHINCPSHAFMYVG